MELQYEPVTMPWVLHWDSTQSDSTVLIGEPWPVIKYGLRIHQQASITSFQLVQDLPRNEVNAEATCGRGGLSQPGC